MVTLSGLSAPAMAADRCADKPTTLAMNQCLQQLLAEAETTMAQYLAASRERYLTNEQVLHAMSQAQTTWQQYRDHHCDSIYSIWIEGTIRGPVSWRCLIQQTRQRSYELWDSYLRFMDNTPPLLPPPRRPDIAFDAD